MKDKKFVWFTVCVLILGAFWLVLTPLWATQHLKIEPAKVLKKWLYGVQVYAPDPPSCGGVTFTGVVALTEAVPATSSAVVVSLRSSRPEIVKVPATVSVPPGEGAAKFNVATIPIAQSGLGITIVATVGADTAVSNIFRIRGPRVANLHGSPGGPCNGQKVKFTATLDCPGPAEPVAVSFYTTGKASSGGSEKVGPGDTTVSHKITFDRCCLGNVGAGCSWGVNARVVAPDNYTSNAHAGGTCGQPNSCPN